MLRFGPYEVHEEIGRGGMGVVYRGFDPLIRRDVALKTIKLYDIADESERRQMQERLEREAQSAGRLSHPSIVTIYQVGYEEIRPGETVAFIAMEYVAGWTLATVLEKTRVTNHSTVLRLLRQAAEALDYAHSQGVVHRDVKPANLLITQDGRLKIADFGLAKLLSHTMTVTGTIMGSPCYMSPEQVRAEPVDGRSDQYALAVVAFEVFGGKKPYHAETLSALVYKIAHEAPPPLELAEAELAGRLNPVLRRAMSKDPRARFATCVEFVESLEKASSAPEPDAVASKSAAPPPSAAPATPRQTAQAPVMPRKSVLQSPRPQPPVSASKAKPAVATQKLAVTPRSETPPMNPQAVVENAPKPEAAPPPPSPAPEPVKQQLAPPPEPVKTAPKLLQQAPAAYTNQARAAGIEGIVLLSVDLNDQGVPIRARVLKPLDPGLDRSAVQSLAAWRFQPATENGKPVGATVNVEVKFNLVGGPSRQRPSLKTVK